MAKKTTAVDTEQYRANEKKIINFLYENPGANYGTSNLMMFLNQEALTSAVMSSDQEKDVALKQRIWDDTQYAIETLVKDRLVKGQRAGQAGTYSSSPLS